MITLTKISTFCASHRLFRPEWSHEKNVEIFGKCANVNGHGHNYKLEVSVSADRLDPMTAMIIEANALKKIINEVIINEVDHKHLNMDVPWIEGVPTAELLVSLFWDRLSEALKNEVPDVKLTQLKLWETESIYVTRQG